MYSFVLDFNLNGDDKQVEQYLTSMISEWPDFYASVDGVRGTYYLTSALGLAGKYTCRQVVDLDDLGALRGIDEAMQKNAKWAAARQQWLKARKEVSSTLVRHEGGDRRLMNHMDVKSGDRTLVYKTALAATQEGRRAAGKRMVSSLRGIDGVRAARALAPLVSAKGGHIVEVWTVVEDYHALDHVAETSAMLSDSFSGVSVARTQVFGIARVDAGRFIHTA